MTTGGDGDVENGQRTAKIAHWRLVTDQSYTTPEIEHWEYEGSGTEEDPYIVEWIDNDPRNPLTFSKTKKWMITFTMAAATLTVSFCSSAYSAGIQGLRAEFGASQEVAILGLSIFVLGFALGPLIWAPLSELYGRQIIFFITFGAFAAFNAGFTGSQNMPTVIVTRFFAASFGASPLTNAGGVVADLFSAKERGLAMSIFSVAPFMGPVLGPICGGFLGEAAGWRWIGGLMSIFSGFCWILGALLVPETYMPVLLRQRASRLSKLTGKVYMSRGDYDQGKVTATEVFTTSLKRPWILLFMEPIVLLLSIYMAIIYGTLYLLFSAFPQTYQVARGWSVGIGGLAFIGVAIGMLIALAYNIFVDDKKYQREVEKHNGFAPPEARLHSSMLGGLALPIGLFMFAWTNYPSIHWAVSISAGIPFGFGMVLVFLSIMNYLVDAYTIFAASVLAANSVLRSLFGTAFPLFTQQMYDALGIHWAPTIPAFLALLCTPFPFLFYKYGAQIRKRCKYAAEADRFNHKVKGKKNRPDPEKRDVPQSPHSSTPSSPSSDISKDLEHSRGTKRRELEETEQEQDMPDYTWKDESSRISDTSGPIIAPIRRQGRGRRSAPLHGEEYEHSNPYDIDRVNTRESFGGPRARSGSSGRTHWSSRSRG